MTDPRRAARRGLATAAVVCAAGAGLALFAATRTWSSSTVPQPAPLPAKTVAHTGSALLGWLPALALVGLAGAGALLATRGRGRIVVGLVMLLVGLGVVGGGIDGIRIAASGWPVAVVIGGIAVVWVGFATMRSGASWPAMGARYERPATAPGASGRGARLRGPEAGRDDATPAGADGRTAGARPRRTPASMWDDLDRGVDPTDRDA